MSLWLTYAWTDNEHQDVEFLVQELKKTGVNTLIDRYVLETGQHLWPQIDKIICSPEKCSAWAIYVTEKSLNSSACQEEFLFALNRALETRGNSFPLIGIFPTHFNKEKLPTPLKTRLCVSLASEDWQSRIKAAVERQTFIPSIEEIKPYEIREHIFNDLPCLEFRTRIGIISPIIIAFEKHEQEKLISLIAGPTGLPTASGMVHERSGETDDGLIIKSIGDEITPSKSLFIHMQSKISYLKFGEESSQGKIKWLATYDSPNSKTLNPSVPTTFNFTVKK